MRTSSARALHLRRNLFALIAIVICTVLFFIMQTNIVRADQFSWTGESNPTIASADSAAIPSDYCLTSRQMISIAGVPEKKSICVTEGSRVRFGIYNPTGSSTYALAVGFGYDSQMYPARGVCGESNDCLYLPDKDILITKRYLSSQFVRGLVIYRNFSQRLTRTINQSNLATEYTFDDSHPDYAFRSADGYGWPVGGLGASENEQWLAFEPRDRGVLLLNLDTFAIKRISNQKYNYGTGSDPGMEFDVANSGQHIAMMGYNTGTFIFDISTSCGDEPTDDQLQENKPIAEPCPRKEVDIFSDSFIERFHEGYRPQFSSDGGELSFYATSYTSPSKFVTLRANGYQPPIQLDYLALGDSYSSGEGDTELTSDGQKRYLALTDVNGDYSQGIPREKCHQSSRAWPFLLADSSGISEDKKETVACSGALIGDVASSKQIYNGQARGGDNDSNKPRLESLPNISTLQQTALEDFTPGRIKQIDFVEKYKPKAITLTIGGNNVNFGEIILSCTFQSIGSTCDYANGAEETSILGKLIASQYNSLVTLYTRIHEISPTTKIYALGYPKFVSTGHSCGRNVQLDEEERIMSERAVEYLNNVIESAAKRAGAAYINIEDSLNGKRLCDTDKPYMTGLAAWKESERQESFHPNHQGNELMADAIKSELEPDTILTHRNCPLSLLLDFCPDSSVSAPEPTVYFADAMNAYNRSVQNEQMTNETINKTDPQNIKTNPFSLQPGSNANLELHSDPVNLGEYIVNQDGSLSEDIIIPSTIPAGYHTLHIHGNSYSGEPIDLTQVIEVQGAKNDIDEDAIQDVSDPCFYVPAANIDADYDGIDDACDPYISEPTQPYRARNGNVDNGENANFIYIERNINATSSTGISNDYDPDNDSWAIVANSFNKSDSGVLNRFWLDGDKVPHIIVQVKKNSCFQFTPKSLAKVEPNNKRKLVREEKSTVEC